MTCDVPRKCPSACGLQNHTGTPLLVRVRLKTHASDIAQGRRAKQTLVFPTELRGTFVAHEIAGLACIESLVQHQLPSLLQAHLLLELQRAHTGDVPKVLAERRRRHVGVSSQRFQVQGPFEVFSEPGEGLGHSLARRAVGNDVAKLAAFIKDGIDSTSVEGGSTLPYRISNLRVDLHTPDDIPVPIQWWRVVGHSHNAFSTECFFDELAQMAGQDPVAWRLAMLEGHPRHIETLKLVALKAEWDKPLPPGKPGERRGRGVALHEAFGSVVAQVAEVTVQSDGQFKVDRVVCSVDCGIAVNPDVIRAQVEGSIGFALSAALHEAITLTDGKIDQSNFHNNEPLRIYTMPRVEVHIVPSASPPTGIGEPPVAPLAPAVVNALAAATGKRIRRLPISNQLSA